MTPEERHQWIVQAIEFLIQQRAKFQADMER